MLPADQDVARTLESSDSLRNLLTAVAMNVFIDFQAEALCEWLYRQERPIARAICVGVLVTSFMRSDYGARREGALGMERVLEIGFVPFLGFSARIYLIS